MTPAPGNARRSKYWVSLTALLVLAVAGGVGLFLSRDKNSESLSRSIGRQGGSIVLGELRLRVPPGALSKPTTVRVARVGRSPDVLGEATTPRSATYAVEADAPLLRPAELRFRIFEPPDAAPANPTRRSQAARGRRAVGSTRREDVR